MDDRFKLQAKFSFVYIVIAFLALLMLQKYVFGPLMAADEEVPYSRFRHDLAQGLIEEVTVEPDRIVYTLTGALGPVRYAGPAGSGYLGDQVATRNLSSDIENLIDAEIRRHLDGAQETALDLLTTHEAALREIARVLQEDEVIDGETVSMIVADHGPGDQ